MAKNQAWLSTSVTVSLPNRSVYRTEAARGNTLTYFDPSTSPGHRKLSTSPSPTGCRGAGENIVFSITNYQLPMTKILLPDRQATEQLGITLGETLTAGSVILLQGDLGAGKTTLVQGIGKCLGIIDYIVSPTFTLFN